jgi:hypothetical protein
MQVTLDSSPEMPLFDVPREHSGAILSSLQTYSIDRNSPKWVVLGDIHMKCR